MLVHHIRPRPPAPMRMKRRGECGLRPRFSAFGVWFSGSMGEVFKVGSVCYICIRKPKTEDQSLTPDPTSARPSRA